jgi:hypothetical protein
MKKKLDHYTEGHFTLWLSLKRIRDSYNLIGGERKFVHLAFRLEANGLQNVYMAALFGSFCAKNLSNGRKLVRNIYGNPSSSQADKLFFFNLYKIYNLYILMNFYLVLLREVCLRSSRSYGQSMKYS